MFVKSVFNMLFFTVIFISCSEKEETLQEENIINITEPKTPLKDATKTFFVGMAVRANRLEDGSEYDKIIKREYESITAEYEMKMNVILPSKGNYNWSNADKIVDYAIANGLNVHGHALIWHESTPEWLENYSGTDEEFEQEIKEYITNVLQRYKGKVTSWDVINEGVNNSGGTLRNTVFRQRMGDDYMAKCLQFARDADPNAMLFYNDYGMCTNISKQNKVFDLVADWKNRNIPIDGIGYQMHISYLKPIRQQIEIATDRAIASDLLLHYSELDIRTNPNKDITVLTEERAIAQKLKYKEVVQIYNTIPTKNQYALTIWGMKDDDSWLLPHHNNDNEWPLLYDKSFDFKKAHTGFLEGLN